MWRQSFKVFCKTVPLTAAAGISLSPLVASCEGSGEANRANLLRKRTTLQQANMGGCRPTRRFDTKDELSKLRLSEKEMLLRWERDEDGWRELPARAWPVYQPNEEQLETIKEWIGHYNCKENTSTSKCNELLFNMATSLVFYNLDPPAGLKQYEKLAHNGNVDAMVACGIILIEGMGVPPQERQGLQWLQKAVEAGSAQGCFELGTVLYTGIDDVIEEDPEGAFELFERAAQQGHTGAMYMVADCLIEGEGTEKNVGRAVPLLYQAAERGHRYSRQRVRELLAKKEYR